MDKIISKAEAQRRGRRGKKFWKSACCDADVVLGAGRQLWCTVCFQDCVFFDQMPATRTRSEKGGICVARDREGLMFITLFFDSAGSSLKIPKELNVVVEPEPQTVCAETHAACWFEVLHGAKVVKRTTIYKEALAAYKEV